MKRAVQGRIPTAEGGEMKSPVGHHLYSEVANKYHWYSVWPAINRHGIIRYIVDGDCIPDDAILVDWSTSSPRNGHAVVVTGERGFEAILTQE